MIRVLGIAVVLLAAAAAQGATVELRLDINPAGTWQILATASPASISDTVYPSDNAGLAAFAINMKNITTSLMAAPKGFDGTKLTNAGFTLGGVTPDLATSEFEILGGQNTTDPNTLVYGMGQVAGTIPGLAGVIPDTTWTQPVVVVTGTYVVGQQTPVIMGAQANVFTAAGGVTATDATVVIIPEPVTLTLLGIGALALLRRRR